MSVCVRFFYLSKAAAVTDCKGRGRTADNAAEVDWCDTVYTQQGTRRKQRRKGPSPGCGGTRPMHLSHCPGPTADSPG